MEISKFLKQIKEWGQNNSNVDSVLLVGSHARGKGRPDSDIDLVIICKDPTQMLEEVTWIKHFGEIINYSIEDWGLVQSLRTFYKDGREIEFGITSPKWTAIPADAGTKQVVA